MASPLLWELPSSFFEGASLAALHSGGYRAAPAAAAVAAAPHPAAGRPGGGDDRGADEAGNTDAWRESGFGSLAEWRAHTRTDLYRLNARRRAAGRAPLTDAEFERAVAECDLSSISGSNSSSEEEEGAGRRRAPVPSAFAAKLVFSRPTGELFAVWRAALCSPADDKGRGAEAAAAAVPRLLALRASPGDWLLILARGGHFAAVVLRMSAGVAGCVVAHKTLHRYVVRAKQGGRQTVVDGGGKAIHSAGSALRRANEASLARDVRALLAVDWAHHTRAAQTLWLAVSDADRRTLVGEGAPLGRGDPRLRNVPFPTRRPTLAEAKRTALRLAQLDTGLQPQADSEDEEEGGARGGPGGAAAAHPPAVPAPDEPPLHAAARRGDVAAVAALLSAVGCDPTALFGGALAYELAPSRAVRDAFRRAAGRPGCGWDALAAGVSAPLTAEAEAAAAERRTRRAASRARDAADAQRADDARGREEEARRAEARQKDGRALEAAKAGTSGKAAALLGAVRSKEAAAREARAAAAEARMRNARLG